MTIRHFVTVQIRGYAFPGLFAFDGSDYFFSYHQD